ncbi:putative ribonuclease H-like domain-containing protein [Tanacetum coccineum]
MIRWCRVMIELLWRNTSISDVSDLFYANKGGKINQTELKVVLDVPKEVIEEQELEIALQELALKLKNLKHDGGYVTFGGGAHGGRISEKEEAVSTACYVQNRVLEVKPHNKTPYELFRGLKPALTFMRPFGCHVTILNTLDNLGKFDGKSDEGFFVGYSLSSKAFRVYNTRTKRVEENLHIGFLENKSMIEGNGPRWLFDIDSLTQSINYIPVVAGTISNESAGTHEELNAGTSTQKEEISQDYIVMPIWKDVSYFDSPSKDVGNGEPKSASDDQKQVEDDSHNESDEKDKSKDDISPMEVMAADNMLILLVLKLILDKSYTLSPQVEFFINEDEPEVIPSLIQYSSNHFLIQNPYRITQFKNVIGDVKSSIQTRRMTKSTSEQGFLSAVYEQKTHDTLNTCLYACFLSQIEPTSNKTKRPIKSDSSWVEAMQEELLQFKLQQVWKLVDLPNGKRAIGTKWVFRNKKDERGIVIRNKARLVAQGFFWNNPNGVKSAFLYGTIEEEVYVTQPPGFKDPDHLDKVYKVVKALYGLHQALRAWITSTIEGRWNIYVAEILKKFNYIDVKSASTPVDLEKPLVKDGDADDVDVHLYRSMIGSLMYLTTSRPDIMFAVCACARFQVTPKTSHLLAVKRIFRYLKGKPTLGLWYSRDSPFKLVAYTDSDYAGATQDRKSTTGDCQFLGNRHVKRGQDTKIPQSSGPPVKVGDEAVHKELGDRMKRAATTASSLESSASTFGNITIRPIMATK